MSYGCLTVNDGACCTFPVEAKNYRHFRQHLHVCYVIKQSNVNSYYMSQNIVLINKFKGSLKRNCVNNVSKSWSQFLQMEIMFSSNHIHWAFFQHSSLVACEQFGHFG